MIKSFKNAKTRKVHGAGKPKGFKGLDGKWAVEVFDMLETNNSLDDLPRLASYGLHALKGNRKGQWAMTINGPWRVCFTPSEEGWENVEIVDYH